MAGTAGAAPPVLASDRIKAFVAAHPGYTYQGNGPDFYYRGTNTKWKIHIKAEKQANGQVLIRMMAITLQAGN